MTKKDYELIANVISHTKSHYIEPVRQKEVIDATLEVLADELAERLQIDNPRFDYERFMKACDFELI